MNIALVDDLATDLDKLESCLREYASIHQLDLDLQRFSGAEQFLKEYHPLKYTVIFLDIYMDGMNGIEAAEKIRETDADTLLVFLTTSEEHRADAFRFHAYDYLHKPYNQSNVFRTMDHILRLHTEEDSRRFFFTCNRKNCSLRYADLVCLETNKNYLLIQDTTGQTWRTRMTFSAAANLLSEDPRFLTIVRGLIVNMDHIQHLSNGICHLDNGTRLPVTARNIKAIRQMLHNYHFLKIRREALRKGGQL